MWTFSPQMKSQSSHTSPRCSTPSPKYQMVLMESVPTWVKAPAQLPPHPVLYNCVICWWPVFYGVFFFPWTGCGYQVGGVPEHDQIPQPVDQTQCSHNVRSIIPQQPCWTQGTDDFNKWALTWFLPLRVINPDAPHFAKWSYSVHGASEVRDERLPQAAPRSECSCCNWDPKWYWCTETSCSIHFLRGVDSFHLQERFIASGSFG